MWAIKSVEDLDLDLDFYNCKKVFLGYDKVFINPNQKIILIDYDTNETKIVYCYHTLFFCRAIFKTCETFNRSKKFNVDMTKVIGCCNYDSYTHRIILRPCSRKLYRLLDYIERIDVLKYTDNNNINIFIARADMGTYDERNIFGGMAGVGSFDISDLLVFSALAEREILNEMIDNGIIYITNYEIVIKVILVRNKDIRRFITKLVTLNSNSELIRSIVSIRRFSF